MTLICSANDVQGVGPITGLDVARAGHALLAADGVTDPTEAELAHAYELAAATLRTSSGPAEPPVASVNGKLVAKAKALLAERLIFEPTETEFLTAIADAKRVNDNPPGCHLTGIEYRAPRSVR